MKALTTMFSLAIFACALNAHAQTRENGGRHAPLAIEISFASHGSGIDRTAKDRIDAAIQDLRDAGQLKKYVETYEGREGDVTLCVEMRDFQETYAFRLKAERIIGDRNTRTTWVSRLSCSPGEIIRPNE